MLEEQNSGVESSKAEKTKNHEVKLGSGKIFLPDFKIQATKSARRMPRRKQAKKDVASCDNLRGAASKHRSEGLRMRELPLCKVTDCYLNKIG